MIKTFPFFLLFVFLVAVGLFFTGVNFSFAQLGPQIYSITPQDGQYPGGAITINGLNFSTAADGNLVQFEQPKGKTVGSVQIASNNGTNLLTILPAKLTAGTVWVTVVADGQGSQSFSYTVKAVPKLLVKGIEPSIVPVNSSYFDITGTGFPIGTYSLRSATDGRFWPYPLTRQSSDRIRVQASPWADAYWYKAGSYSVILRVTPSELIGGVVQESNPFTLTITSPRPTISKVSPSVQVPGGEIVIEGDGFGQEKQNVAVEFLKDGKVFAGMPPDILLPTKIVTGLPDVSAIPYDVFDSNKTAVRVRVAGWPESNSFPLIIIGPPPKLLAAPAQARGGETISLSGAGFKTGTNETTVYFGQLSVLPTQVSSDKLSVKVPDLAPGKYQLQVATWQSGIFIKSQESVLFEILPPLETKEKTIKAIKPYNGQLMIAGQTYTIEWWSQEIKDFCLQLWQSDKKDYQIACNIKVGTNQITTYQWTVKDSQKTGSQYQIKICEDKLIPACGVSTFTLAFKILPALKSPATTPTIPVKPSAELYNVVLDSIKEACLSERPCTEEDVKRLISYYGSSLTDEQKNKIVTEVRAAGGITTISPAPISGAPSARTPSATAPSAPSPGGLISFGCKQKSGAAVPSGGVTIPNPLVCDTVQDLLNSIIGFITWAGLAVAPVMFILAAFFYVTSGGSPERVRTAQKMILYTAIGVAVLLLASGLVKVIQSVIGAK